MSYGLSQTLIQYHSPTLESTHSKPRLILSSKSMTALNKILLASLLWIAHLTCYANPDSLYKFEFTRIDTSFCIGQHGIIDLANMKKDCIRYYHQVEMLEEIVARQEETEELLHQDLDTMYRYAEKLVMEIENRDAEIAYIRMRRWGDRVWAAIAGAAIITVIRGL